MASAQLSLAGCAKRCTFIPVANTNKRVSKVLTIIGGF